MSDDPPICDVCGRTKLPGTVTIGRRVTRFWACGALAGEHEMILAYQEGEVEWDEDETENEMDWDDV